MNHRKLALDEAPLPTAAGITFITPDGLALFLKRSAASDQPGTWAWPGGGIEGNETPEEAARRETSEEIGFTPEGELEEVDLQAHDQGAFQTFSSRVGEHFLPKLNGEHSAYAWAPLSDPPQPLHPGVEATLAKMKDKPAQDHFAFDRATVRRIDPANGHLHVATTNISKANVCPYLGREIPDGASLGLSPDKVYLLYRDPEELARAAPTFNNLPLLSKHIETTAEDHQHEFTIGSTGTDARFEAPYLQNSLVIWDGPYIEMVEDETQKELSSAYRYRADMTPGEIDGVKFDGVMRDIIGNHVALVKEGRAGSDVVVGDSTEELNMSKTALSLKAVMARGALSAFLAPKLAKDAKIPLTSLLAGVTAKNFAAKKPLLLKNLHDTLKGKLAKDESAEGLKVLLDALEAAPVIDDADPMEDAAFEPTDLNKGVLPVEPKETEGEAKDDPMQAVMEFLKGKLSPEDMAQIEALCNEGNNADVGATDDPPPFTGAPVAKKDGSEPLSPPQYPAKDKDMVSKEDLDKAVKGASDAVRAEVAKTHREIRDAERLVKPYVGELAVACDSASAVLKTALGALNVEGIDAINDVNALTVILKQQPVPGAKVAPKEFAFDAAGAKSFAERHPGAARIKNL
jgi:8-oxo-dGTP pyrophosphatase MutT (NUDIX family)